MSGFAPLLVVPTRNRAGLASAAVTSLLHDRAAPLQVWVSDNSTDAGEAERLRDFCAALADPRLRYLRPPQPLAMGRHWDWIVQQALADPAPSHLGFLTDRMAFVDGGVAALLAAAQRHAGQALVYPNDHLDDLELPARLNQHEWTGRLLELASDDFIAHMRQAGWSIALPRLLNCLAPRTLLQRIHAAYGSYVDSISPDIAFGFRLLERDDHFLFLDRPLIVDYAIARSNGHSAARWQQTRDLRDFLQQMDQRGLNYAAPFPGLPGLSNSVFHEYNLVRAASGSRRFARLNPATCFRLLQGDLRRIEDPAERQAQRARAQALLPQSPARRWRDGAADLLQRLAAKTTPRYLLHKTIKSLSRRHRDYARAPWPLLGCACGQRPFAVCEHLSQWPDTAAALAHALHHPLAPVAARSALEYRLRARWLGTLH